MDMPLCPFYIFILISKSGSDLTGDRTLDRRRYETYSVLVLSCCAWPHLRLSLQQRVFSVISITTKRAVKEDILTTRVSPFVKTCDTDNYVYINDNLHSPYAVDAQ